MPLSKLGRINSLKIIEMTEDLLKFDSRYMVLAGTIHAVKGVNCINSSTKNKNSAEISPENANSPKMS